MGLNPSQACKYKWVHFTSGKERSKVDFPVMVYEQWYIRSGGGSRWNSMKTFTKWDGGRYKRNINDLLKKNWPFFPKSDSKLDLNIGLSQIWIQRYLYQNINMGNSSLLYLIKALLMILMGNTFRNILEERSYKEGLCSVLMQLKVRTQTNETVVGPGGVLI